MLLKKINYIFKKNKNIMSSKKEINQANRQIEDMQTIILNKFSQNQAMDLLDKDIFSDIPINENISLRIINQDGKTINSSERFPSKVKDFKDKIKKIEDKEKHFEDDYIISPTEEAKEKSIEHGAAEEKIKVLGFSVRSRFYKNAEGNKKYNTDRPLKCLIMSGGEGSGNMRKIAEKLLDNFNCVVKIAAGRNKKLRKKLEQTLGAKYGNKVEIYGFMKNIQDLMLTSDIAFTRGSPNVMMEAVACNVPLVITGALPGQEEGNPEFAQDHNLGVICTEVKNIKNTISELLANDREKLKEIKHCQKAYADPDIAENIVNFILNIENNNETIV